MESTPENGIWVSPDQTQTIMENMNVLIMEHSNTILKEIQEKKQPEKAEDSEKVEEAEKPEEDDEESEEREKGNQSDHDSDDDDNGKGHGQSGGGQGGGQGKNQEPDQTKKGQHTEEGKKGTDSQDKGKKGGGPEDAEKPGNQIDLLVEGESKAMEAWYGKKEFVVNLVRKLQKDREGLLKEREVMQKEKAELKKEKAELMQYKREDQLSKFSQETLLTHEKINMVKKKIRSFFNKWPGKYPHDKTRCQLPPHPACIQVLENPPMATPTPEMGAGLRTCTYSLTSLAIQVELLLGNKPKYECMQEVRQEIEDMKMQLQMHRSKLEEDLDKIELEKGAPIMETFMKYLMLLHDWGTLAREEVGFMETCIEKMPDSPTLLYAIAPPPEALPRFYPVLYPSITEPADAEEYVLLVREFQSWRAQLDENLKAMNELLQAMEGEVAGMAKDMFTNWAQHQVQLIRLANNLLQHHIISQRMPAERQETGVMDIEIQWLAERLLKARIETNSQAFGSWLATAYWCTQLAKARMSMDPHVLEYQVKGKKQKKKIHMFEKIKASDVCKQVKVSEETSDLVKQKMIDQGEPYDQQREQGMHPDHSVDLIETLSKNRAVLEAGEEKRTAKKMARASARWKGKKPVESSSDSE